MELERERLGEEIVVFVDVSLNCLCQGSQGSGVPSIQSQYTRLSWSCASLYTQHAVYTDIIMNVCVSGEQGSLSFEFQFLLSPVQLPRNEKVAPAQASPMSTRKVLNTHTHTHSHTHTHTHSLAGEGGEGGASLWPSQEEQEGTSGPTGWQ